MHDLAIVIPAYKDQYLKKTLESFSKQTRRDFNIYIGDDCSPNNIKEICNEFFDKLNISYTRFENNIGAKNLVHQWSRCLDLTVHEKWIWLFSDDDLVDSTCVEHFFENQLSYPQVDIFRFNTVVIDQDDKIIRVPEPGPDYESSEEMAYNLLLDKRNNSLADHIFSRKIYNDSGGLVYTEFAQGADWAMSILFSKLNGISIIKGSNFYWRYSGTNISSLIGNVKTQMFNGHLQFIKWIVNHFQYLKHSSATITYNDIIAATKINLKNVLIYHYKGIYTSNIYSIVQITRNELQMSYLEVLKLFFNVLKFTNSNFLLIKGFKIKFFTLLKVK